MQKNGMMRLNEREKKIDRDREGQRGRRRNYLELF